jgi:hypothetical protein
MLIALLRALLWNNCSMLIALLRALLWNNCSRGTCCLPITLLHTLTTPIRDFLLFAFSDWNQQIKEKVAIDSIKA